MKMVVKSMQGYALAFGLAVLLWGSLGPFMKKKFEESPPAQKAWKKNTQQGPRPFPRL